jgi:hypothetical protein
MGDSNDQERQDHVGDRDEPFVIEFRIERRTVRRALLASGALLLFGAGVCFAVPVTFTNGSVLTAAQLNGNFTNVEQRLSALEATQGGGFEYAVQATGNVAANQPGGPVLALCKPGERVVMGSCWSDRAGGALLIYDEGPIFSGTNGWKCSADDPSPEDGTLHVLAVCTSNAPDGGTAH